MPKSIYITAWFSIAALLLRHSKSRRARIELGRRTLARWVRAHMDLHGRMLQSGTIYHCAIDLRAGPWPFLFIELRNVSRVPPGLG